MFVTCSHIVQTTSDEGMQTSFDDPDSIHAYTYEQNLYFVCAPRWKKTLMYIF